MVKDGSGVIWGAASAQDFPVYRLTATGWSAVQSPKDFNRCTRLTTAPDGSVYGLLVNDSARLCAVVQYTPGGAKTLGTFPSHDNLTELLIGRDGTAWVTGSSREIRHVFGHGRPDATYTIPANAFDSELVVQDPAAVTRPVGSSMDGQGRIWFFSKPGEQPWLPSMHGVIVYNGETYTRITSIFGAPNDPIEALVPQDTNHFWALYPDNGLRRIDSINYSAERVAEPSPGAFQHPRQIARDGADWLLMTLSNRRAPQAQRTLWMLHQGQVKSGNSAWTKLADGFEISATWPVASVPAAVTDTGTWIGDGTLGVWWFDRHTGKSQLVDWRRGFPLPGVSSLVKMPDGRVVAAQGNSVPVILPSVPPPAIPTPDIHEHALANLQTGLQADGAGHLWGRRQSGRDTLDEWDGLRWIAHPFPAKMKQDLLTAILPDTSGRIWCIQQQHNGTALYDAKSGNWSLYDDLPAALVAHKDEQGFGFRTDWQFAPRIRNGRIAAYEFGPMYYDGQAWKAWQPQDITSSEYVNGMPYFNPHGDLAMRGWQHEWIWDGKTWGRGAAINSYTPGAEERIRLRLVSLLEALGWPPSSSGQVTGAIEGAGGIWFFLDRTLYTYRSGVVRPLFTNATPNPFLQAPYLQQVRIDALGHIWLGSQRDNGLRYLELTTPNHQPFSLSLTTKSEDSVAATITGDKAAMHEWRIDSEPGVITTDPTRAFTNLPPGEHLVTAQPLTDHLLPIGPPMTMSWQSTVTAGDQMRRLIATLTTGTDAERSEAVNALARYGERATPDLTTARNGASAGGRWWIDTALQEITTRTPSSGPEGNHE